jgi:hypothetical protein
LSVLLDTCIVIDVLREKPEATRLFAGLPEPPHLSVATVTELRAGQRGRRESETIDTILAKSRLHNVTLTIAEEAGSLLLRYGKSHATDVADALIAATAIHYRLELVTLNLKHFPMFPDLCRPC